MMKSTRNKRKFGFESQLQLVKKIGHNTPNSPKRANGKQNTHMYVEQCIVVLSLLSGVLFGLAAFLFPLRRTHLTVSAAVLLLLFLYEIRMDRWEKTVTAPIRLDMFAEIPLMILCLIFGVWQIRSCRKRKAL
jgi:hypothetical protein